MAALVLFSALYVTRLARLFDVACALASGLSFAHLATAFFAMHRMTDVVGLEGSDNHIADAMQLFLLPLLLLFQVGQIAGWNLLVALGTWLSLVLPAGTTIAISALARFLWRRRALARARRRFEELTGESVASERRWEGAGVSLRGENAGVRWESRLR